MDKKIRVFRFYYFRESAPGPMISYYNPEKKECLEFLHSHTEPLPDGFKWFRENGKFSKHEFLLEEALNAILSAGYRIITVIHLENDPDKLTEDQITYQIVAEAIS